MNALLRNEPYRDRAILERTRDRMDQAIRDCLVTGYEALIPTVELPNPDDHHVLAAASVGRLLGRSRHETTAGYALLADAHLVEAADKVGAIIAAAMASQRPRPIASDSPA